MLAYPLLNGGESATLSNIRLRRKDETQRIMPNTKTKCGGVIQLSVNSAVLLLQISEKKIENQVARQRAALARSILIECCGMQQNNVRKSMD